MSDTITAPASIIIDVLENGPLLIHGDVMVKDKDGTETLKQTKTAFCRCGASARKPYCDGSHRSAGFQG